MAGKPKALRDRFGLTVRGTIAVSLGLILLGVAIMGVGPSIVTDDDAEPAILNVGSVVLSIGLISLAYEVYLRATFTRELLALVGLQAHLTEVGIRRVQADNDLNWSALIDGTSDVRLLSAEPLFWVQHHLPRVIAQGRLSPVHLRLYFPNPGGSAMAMIARQCGVDPGNLKAQIEQSSSELRQQWTDAEKSPDPLQSGSEVSLRYFDEVPAVTIFVVDDQAVVIARGVLARRAGDVGIALTFASASGFSVVDWLRSRTERLEGITPHWASEVE